MASLLDTLSSHLDANAITALSEQLGADRNQTSSAVEAALQMLLAALAKNSAQANGATALRTALDDHDGSLLDDVAGAFGQATHATTGDGILRHVLGDRRSAMERGLSGVSGLDPGTAGQLLSLLAPIVMGCLGRQTRTDGLDADSLPSILGDAAADARSSVPGHASILTSLLDRDGDGSVADDLGRLGMGMLGNLLKRN